MALTQNVSGYLKVNSFLVGYVICFVNKAGSRKKISFSVTSISVSRSSKYRKA